MLAECQAQAHIKLRSTYRAIKLHVLQFHRQLLTIIRVYKPTANRQQQH